MEHSLTPTLELLGNRVIRVSVTLLNSGRKVWRLYPFSPSVPTRLETISFLFTVSGGITVVDQSRLLCRVEVDFSYQHREANGGTEARSRRTVMLCEAHPMLQFSLSSLNTISVLVVKVRI